ncbi:LacI family DNA-binding transcriptional regulator [Gilliamella sp. wkB112]|uniref:LacI family DNA-binding transcriptional regulator n=1 Tax=Gilliamella sp. wkB112 TaxID=3120257 RepID=UPI00080E2592|nr:LacI family DNA-binding transcriptional regulator [Gilliamella apicola]OCG01245.1 hypothetical protein A9G12_01430 [Gilliamella apicola]
MIKNKTTLATIAKHANVSIATVSRVLKKPNLTSPITQSKVFQAIEELHVDTCDKVNAHNTITNNKTILIIDNQLISHSLINYGIEQVLNATGYKIFYLRFPYSEDKDIQHLIRYATQNLFAGIIIINEAPYLTKLSQYMVCLPPVILVNHFHAEFNCVYFDHLIMAHQITKYLIEHAHHKIALLLGHPDKISSTHLLQGYKQALDRANLTIDTDYIIKDCFTYEHGQLAVKNLLSSNKPPTAIICADNINLSYLDEKYYNKQHYQLDYRAVLGALAQAHIHQSTAPTLVYISHSNQRHYNELDTLSRMYKPLYKMGQQAAALLSKKVKNNDSVTKHYHLLKAEAIFY